MEEFNATSKVIANNPNSQITLDPEALATISSSVNEASQNIGSAITNLQGYVDSTRDSWNDAAAEVFREKAAELITKLENFRTELEADGAWAGTAGVAGQEVIDDNTSLMNRI